jgi:hypothetical protein
LDGVKYVLEGSTHPLYFFCGCAGAGTDILASLPVFFLRFGKGLLRFGGKAFLASSIWHISQNSLNVIMQVFMKSPDTADNIRVKILTESPTIDLKP